LIHGLELQAAHNVGIIRHIYKRCKSSPGYALEPKAEREAEWVESMQPELDRLATSPKYGPAFYYLSKDGRNTFFWPWTQWYFWWKTRSFHINDYVELTAERQEQDVA